MYDFKDTERKILDFWQKDEIFQKSLEKTEKVKNSSFLRVLLPPMAELISAIF